MGVVSGFHLGLNGVHARVHLLVGQVVGAQCVAQFLNTGGQAFGVTAEGAEGFVCVCTAYRGGRRGRHGGCTDWEDNLGPLQRPHGCPYS